MDVEIHPNAKKHLTEKQVLGAWLAVTECIRRESEDEPPRWLADWMASRRSECGTCCGRTYSWMAQYSCLVSVQKKFWQEIERARQKGSMMGKTYDRQWSGCNG